MGSIFRIARAEFIKIFKRPTVYIMAFILAGIIAGSLFIFNPTPKENTFVNLEGVSTNVSVATLHSKFIDEETYKSEYDEYSSQALGQINFYTDYNKYVSDVEINYNNVTASISKLLEDSVSTNDINNFFTNLDLFITTIENQTFIDSFNSSTPNFMQDYYNSTLYSGTIENIETLRNSLLTLRNSNVDNFIAYFKLNNNQNYNDTLSSIKEAYQVNINYTTSLLEYVVENIKSLINDFNILVSAGSTRTEEANQKRLLLIEEVELYRNYILNIIEKNSYNTAVVLNKDYQYFKTNIDTFKNALIIREGSETNLSSQQTIKNKLSNNTYVENVSEIIDKINYLFCDSELLVSLNNTYLEVQTESARLLADINSFYLLKSSSKDLGDINSYNTLVSKYKAIQFSLKNYVYYSILNDTLNEYSNTYIQKFYGEQFFEKYNIYKVNEDIVKYDYYITNKIYSFELDDVFAFDKSSGSETSVYDFMYFSLKLATVAIIIFSIFMSANIFSAEHDSGTIKLLLIRPFKRHKIISGKLLSTLFFSFAFLLFSIILSFIIGIASFSIPAANVLVIFNASTAFALHPLLLMLLFILMTLLEIVFYLILSSTLCTILKSFAGAISVTTILYIITMAANIGLGNKLWYSYSPFVNVNLFKFFGNGFLINQNSSLSLFFSTPLLGNMNYFISLVITSILSLILITTTYTVFSRRDY